MEKPLSYAEVATIARVSIPTVAKWVKQGKIPHHRPAGGKVYFCPAEIEGWLYGRENTPSAPASQKKSAPVSRDAITADDLI